MHGREPLLADQGDRIQELWGFRFNGITFRVYLCVLIVFVPSILSHIPVILNGDVVRGIFAGLLGVVIAVLGALLGSHFY
jgi:hypothetical protein